MNLSKIATILKLKFTMAAKDQPVNRKACVIQTAPLGDTALLIYFLYKLDYEFDIVCRAAYQPLWQKFFPDSQVIAIEKEKWDIEELKLKLEPLQKGSYSVVISSSINDFTGLVANMIPAEKRVTVIDKRKVITMLAFDDSYFAEESEHVIERYRNLFGLTGLTKLKETLLDNKAGNYVLLHPGAKWAHRRWPKERFLKISHWLHSINERHYFLIHESEKELMDYFYNEVPGRIKRTRDIDDLVTAVEGCSLLIGNDSGPVHLAGLFGKARICLWGPGNYERIHPVGENLEIIMHEVPCRPCRQYKDVCENGENICMQLITVEEVKDAAKKMLGKMN